jgi:hypothetical protein
MKPIGSKWKRLIVGCNDVWEVIAHNGDLHECKCIVGGRYAEVGHMLKFYIYDSSELWEPYYNKSSNFKDIYVILNNED